MSGCGLMCALAIWSVFLWPIIVSISFLIIQKEQIVAKGKYFLLSTAGGYILLVGANSLMNFIAGKFIENKYYAGADILGYTTPILLYLPTVILSYILFRKMKKNEKNIQK